MAMERDIPKCYFVVLGVSICHARNTGKQNNLVGGELLM
jgi:hypothetical protein